MYEQKSHYVTDWLDMRAHLSPSRVALIDGVGGREDTYAEWNRRVNRTANFLAELGVGKGDRVSVHATNCVPYVDLLFACGKIGAILHNLNWRLAPAELGAIIADATPKVLCYSSDWKPRINEMRPSLAGVEHFVVLDEPGEDPPARSVSDRRLAERDAYPAELTSRPALSLDDPWVIFYTGGTTGLPKGAVLTHGNMTWHNVNTITGWGLTASHCAPLQHPMFHVGGPNLFMVPLVHVGGATVLCRGFDVDETFDLVNGGVITHYVAVPTMYIMMQRHPRWQSTDFSRLELVISGGAPCPQSVMEAFWERGVDFKMGYGLTEATGNNFWLPPADVRRKPRSVGFPLPHVDVAIRSPDGARCGPDEPGELLIRGPHVMAGYWNRPAATAEAIQDGWLHTGDLAQRDAEGYVTIIGRSKEMFISGGENVYPAEVESALHAHPAVAEAAVIGVPHETWGEVGRAFVALEDGQSVEVDALLSFLRDRLAKYKLPRDVIFLDELPKTAVGKLDKKQLSADPLPGADD